MKTLSKLRKSEIISEEDATKLLENGITEVGEKNKGTVEKLLDKDIDLEGKEESQEESAKKEKSNTKKGSEEDMSKEDKMLSLMERMEERLDKAEKENEKLKAKLNQKGGGVSSSQEPHIILTNKEGTEYGVRFNEVAGAYSDNVKSLSVKRSKEDRRDFSKYYGRIAGNKRTIHFTIHSNDMVTFRNTNGNAIKLSDKAFVNTAEMVIAHMEKTEELLG